MEMIKKYIDLHHFDYYYINQYDEKKLNKYIQKIVKKFANEGENWDIEKNTIWLFRQYVSIKMMLSSTVLFSYYEFSEDKHLYLSTPYYEYYGLLNSCRAFILSKVDKDKNDFETVFKATHSHIINYTIDSLQLINSNLAKNFKLHITKLKERREMYSYNFPTKAVQEELNTYYQTLDYAKLLCEMTQLNSYILQESKKYYGNKNPFKFEVGYIKEEVEKYFFSEEDSYRLNYFKRKVKTPYNLLDLCTDWLVEDFLFTFTGDYNEENGNVCLHNLQLIFPFP